MLTRFYYLIACVAFVKGAAIHLKDTLEDEQIISPHIVGGSQTHVSIYPHQVSLRYKAVTCPQCSYEHRCGGSIYDNETIITAAHCTLATVASQFQVVAGTSHRRGSDGVIVPVKEIIMHELYNSADVDYDIAILKLGTPLPFNNFTINKVELAEEDYSNGTAVVTGWGALSYGGAAPEVLQAVTVPLVSNEACDIAYGGNRISEAMLCAGISGKGACQGDSGGPLLVNGKLAGVVSWGYRCADPRYPSVYAKVSYLRSWVLDKIASQKLKG